MSGKIVSLDDFIERTNTKARNFEHKKINFNFKKPLDDETQEPEPQSEPVKKKSKASARVSDKKENKAKIAPLDDSLPLESEGERFSHQYSNHKVVFEDDDLVDFYRAAITNAHRNKKYKTLKLLHNLAKTQRVVKASCYHVIVNVDDRISAGIERRAFYEYLRRLVKDGLIVKNKAGSTSGELYFTIKKSFVDSL